MHIFLSLDMYPETCVSAITHLPRMFVSRCLLWKYWIMALVLMAIELPCITIAYQTSYRNWYRDWGQNGVNCDSAISPHPRERWWNCQVLGDARKKQENISVFFLVIDDSLLVVHKLWESVQYTMDMLWEKLQWILPLYMKPISFQSNASLVCSVTTAIFIDFCLKKLNVFPNILVNKTNEYLNSAEQMNRKWNASVLIPSWDLLNDAASTYCTKS